MNATDPVQDLVSAAWRDHADDPGGVWARIVAGVDRCGTAEQRVALAGVLVHVAGEHLGRWDDGIATLDRLIVQDPADGPLPRVLRRNRATLSWCAGRRDEAEATLAGALDPARPPESSRGRVLAVAAAALAGQRRFAEAAEAFEQALAAAAYGPGADDPLARSLAVTGNNVAAALEELADRDDAGTALMRRAAAAGRTWWAVAGTWSNVVLADVRLAFTHLAAGEPDVALRHAQAALAGAEAHGAGPDDRLAPLVALARASTAAARAGLAAADPGLAAAYAPLLGP